MALRSLIDADCGQSNAISQLVQHVTEDQRFQGSIGDPRSSIVGPTENNLMLPPQSFRMNDLMRELGQIEPPKMPIASPSSSSPGTTWTTEYQNHMQENSQFKIDQMWNEMNVQNCRNEANYFPVGNFVNNVMPSPLYQLPESQNFESEFREPRVRLADLEDMITIKNIDELKQLDEPEESSTYSQEIEDKQLPEQHCKKERKTIPEFKNTGHFGNIIETYIKNCREKDGKLDIPFKTIQQNILNSKEYSHIENNPMKDELDVLEKGEEAMTNDFYTKASLYFDEAVRRNKRSAKHWFRLGLSLSLIHNKEDEAMSAMKHYLQLNPNCFHGAFMITMIYTKYECNYQACQTAFNWLKNNKLYNHLIPPDFSMEDKDTVKLDKEQLNSVKSIFLKAARQSPINVDADLQILIGSLYALSYDYDKMVDCKLAAVNASSDKSELINVGYCQFFGEEPHEALATFFRIAADPEYELLAYEGIAFVYTYLKNFREAIRYFRKGLSRKSIDESKFQLEGNTLEDEYDLCLRLNYEIRNK